MINKSPPKPVLRVTSVLSANPVQKGRDFIAQFFRNPDADLVMLEKEMRGAGFNGMPGKEEEAAGDFPVAASYFSNPGFFRQIMKALAKKSEKSIAIVQDVALKCFAEKMQHVESMVLPECPLWREERVILKVKLLRDLRELSPAFCVTDERRRDLLHETGFARSARATFRNLAFGQVNSRVVSSLNNVLDQLNKLDAELVRTGLISQAEFSYSDIRKKFGKLHEANTSQVIQPLHPDSECLQYYPTEQDIIFQPVVRRFEDLCSVLEPGLPQLL